MHASCCIAPSQLEAGKSLQLRGQNICYMLNVDLLGYGEVFKKGKKRPYSLLLISCNKGSLMLYNSRALMISSTEFPICVAPKAELPDNTEGLP